MDPKHGSEPCVRQIARKILRQIILEMTGRRCASGFSGGALALAAAPGFEPAFCVSAQQDQRAPVVGDLLIPEMVQSHSRFGMAQEPRLSGALVSSPTSRSTREDVYGR